jgi:hypothetical protein
VEVQSRGLNPQDSHEGLTEFVKLRRCLKEVEVEQVTEVRRLAILVRMRPKFWWTLACLPSRGSPEIHVRPTTYWRQWAASWNAYGRPTPPFTIPGIRCRPSHVAASSSCPTLVFCLFISSLICEYI